MEERERSLWIALVVFSCLGVMMDFEDAFTLCFMTCVL